VRLLGLFFGRAFHARLDRFYISGRKKKKSRRPLAQYLPEKSIMSAVTTPIQSIALSRVEVTDFGLNAWTHMTAISP
jgi:hypothetical protein